MEEYKYASFATETTSEYKYQIATETAERCYAAREFSTEM